MNDQIFQLHTPEELMRLSNLAHIAEGILMLVLGILLAARGFGYLQKQWQAYLLPGIGLLAAFTLFSFMFFDHLNELSLAWQVLTKDMKQRQHLWIGAILGVTAILTMLGLKIKNNILIAAMSFGLLAIGIIFLIHPQHGSGAAVARAFLIHKGIGISIIVGFLAHAGGVFFKQWHKPLSLVAGFSLVISAILLMCYREPFYTPMSH